MKTNVISMRMSSPSFSKKELYDQQKLFIDVALSSGYTIIKKVIYKNDLGYGVVEVEGIK